jgi:hypothetical protein
MTYHNLWDRAKALLRGKFIAMIAYIKDRKISNKNLMLHLKLLEKQEQAKLISSKRRKITKIRA